MLMSRLRPLLFLLLFATLAPPACADAGAAALQALRAGDAARALELTDRALAAAPRDAVLRFTRGVVLTELRRDDDAMRVFTALIEDHPDLAEPYNNLAVLQARRGDTGQARLSLEAAVRNQPQHAISQENLGDIYGTLAAQAWARAAEIDPSRRSAAAKLALIQQLHSRPIESSTPTAATR